MEIASNVTVVREAVRAREQEDRAFLKQLYHTCTNCGKMKSGGRCKPCTLNRDAIRKVAVKARRLYMKPA